MHTPEEPIITIHRILLPVTEVTRKTIITDLRKKTLTSVGISNNKTSFLKSRNLFLVAQPLFSHTHSKGKGPGLVCLSRRPGRGAIALSIAT